jgi:lysozyme
MSRGRIIGGVVAAASIATPLGAYYEGVFPTGYADPVGIPTDCVGDTHGARIGVQRYTFDQCVANYTTRLRSNWDNGLAKCISRDVTAPQGAALMSFSDNVGIGAACTSKMVRLLNDGAPPATWCAQMFRWTKATILFVKVELPGLVKRRDTEYRVCIAPDIESARAALPSQSVGG